MGPIANQPEERAVQNVSLQGVVEIVGVRVTEAERVGVIETLGEQKTSLITVLINHEIGVVITFYYWTQRCRYRPDGENQSDMKEGRVRCHWSGFAM